MTRFYLKTIDETPAGPFTGIELREAAFAFLIAPDTGVGGTARGPWMRALDIGLFSDSHAPLPHPPGTVVPKFLLSNADRSESNGPYQLRELIDLAVEQSLPSDASIQPVGRSEWIPVSEFGILGVCLKGGLSQNLAPASAPVAMDTQPHSPEHRWHESPTHDPNTEPTRRQPTDAIQDETPPVNSDGYDANPVFDAEDDSGLTPGEQLDRVRENIRKNIANKREPKFKVIAMVALAAPILIGVLLWLMMEPSIGRADRSDVVGSWVRVPSMKESAGFGISLKEDGTCVVFNSDGACWSGDFQWMGHATGEAALKSRGSMNGKIDEIPIHHHRDVVKESDGYVRLQGGPSNKPPTLEGITIRECFLRRDDDFIWIGYPTGAETTGGTSLAAAWVQLWPRRSSTILGPIETEMGGNALLARYGMPNEARPLEPDEVAANSDAKSAEPLSLLRYGSSQLALFDDGSVHRFKSP